MIELIDVRTGIHLEDYAASPWLRLAVDDLRAETAQLRPQLSGRTVWMINSSARGGGVAEMLPRLVTLLQQLGVPTKWAVIHPEDPGFFPLTKRLHNLIHGQGDPHLEAADRELYEGVSRRLGEELVRIVHPEDLLVFHDPQPAAAGAFVKEATGAVCLWRCHIGLDQRLPQTHAAWRFLRPWLERYDHTIFSAPDYIPDYLAGRASIVPPGIDPLSHKNRELSPVKLTGVLCNAGIVPEHQPVLTPPFPNQARRLQPDGTFGSAIRPEEFGALFRPLVVQVSRWDRLKGWRPLLEGFVRLKQMARKGDLELRKREMHRMEIVRLVLAGPDPTAVQDDPEAQEVLDELSELFQDLDPDMQRQVAILSLPMESLKYNALMVNALQRVASVAVQNSIQEGFGLVVTEAMWKQVPVLASAACGIRQQIHDGIDGKLVYDPSDPKAVAEGLLHMLCLTRKRDTYAQTAQRRVHDEFLVFRQLRRYLTVLAECAARRHAPTAPP